MRLPKTMRLPKWMKFSGPMVVVCFCLPAFSDSNPAKMPALAAAMHAAKTVYLVQEPLQVNPNVVDWVRQAAQKVERENFVLFYAGLQKQGRFVSFLRCSRPIFFSVVNRMERATLTR